MSTVPPSYPGRRLKPCRVLIAAALLLPCPLREARGADATPPANPTKLIFIHHSTGEAWLGDESGGLGTVLRNNNYFTSDTNYGWGPPDADVGSDSIGDHTDFGHWYNWFLGPNRDAYMNALYSEGGRHCEYARMPSDPGGANEIVMFKSCFPNSHLEGSVGDPIPAIGANPLRGQDASSAQHTFANAKGIYVALLDYFATRTDKLFIVVTAPPLLSSGTDAQAAANARAFNNWLVRDYLRTYPHKNVFVFDFFNVLTSNGGSDRTNNPNANDLGWADGNHHRWRNGSAEHLQTVANNFSAYGSAPDDSHPSAAGLRKAAEEFVPLLNAAYHAWKGDAGACTLACTATAPASVVQGRAAGYSGGGVLSGCTGNITYDWDFGDGSPHASEPNPQHTYATAGTYHWKLSVTGGGASCSKSGTLAVTAESSGCPKVPLVTGTQIYPVPSLAEPDARNPFEDPVFGTCVVRVTDRTRDLAPEDDSPGLKNEYSRVQSFNADDSLILARGISATWYLYDARTLDPIGILPVDGSVDPRWDARNPDVLYYSSGTRLMRLDVKTRVQTPMHEFADDFPGQNLVQVWGRYEGSPSADGRYWGLMAHDADWNAVALLVYDMLEDRVISRRSLSGVPNSDTIDSVSISPLGNYFAAYYDFCPPGTLGTDQNPCGLMVYPRDLSSGRGLHRIMGHSDFALDSQGREVIIYQDIDTDNIALLDLATGTVTNLFQIDFSHAAIGLHFSGRGYFRPGWALVSTYDGDPVAHTWMDDSVFAVELKKGGKIVRLAHTHSLVDDEQEHDYWAEPHASSNRDMTRILFTSNWGRSGTGQTEMYMIRLPRGWAADAPSVSADAIVFPCLETKSSQVGSSRFTGLAVANLGTTDRTLTFTAYETSGMKIGGPHITNPSTLTLESGRQLALLDHQIFGAGFPLRNPAGWVALEGGDSAIEAFFLFFDSSLSVLDGADVSSTRMSSLIFPEIESGGAMEYHVVNPGNTEVTLSVELRGADGSRVGSPVTRRVPAGGSLAEGWSDLFGSGTASTSNYVRVDSTAPVVGFQHFGPEGKYIAGLNGQDAAGGATVLYAPQYAVGTDWRTALSVINLEDAAGSIVFRLFGDDGSPIGRTRTLTVPAQGKLTIDDPEFFVTSGGALTQGWVEITSSGPRLVGGVVFGDPSRSRFSASLPLVSGNRDSAVFGQVASNRTYFTGLAFVNVRQQSVAIRISVYDSEGRQIASSTETIGPRRRISRLLTQYFPELSVREIGSGYIKVDGDAAFAGFALFGTTDLSVLAAIPARSNP